MAIVPTIGGRSCLHPGEAFRAAQDNATPFDFWQRANSYTCPLGAEPGSAWLLMLRNDLDKLDGNASHELRWVDGKRVLTIPSLAIVKSSTMNLALAGDKKAARLVEFQDRRRVLKLFSSINTQYNVRIPAPSTTSGAGLYYTDSINTSVVWTWQTMLDDVWGNLPGADTAPTLPYSPDGTPEGFRFIGVSAWEALHEVLTKINCTTAYDPINDSYSFVRLGTTQANLAASLTAEKNRLMYDFDPGQDYQLASMPETVRVFFQRRELYHGIELDTPDASNWEMAPVVSKDRATSITGAESGSVLVVRDDLPAEFDDTGVNSNSAALVTRANEIGDNVRDRIDVSDERLRRMFSGLVTDILPGSEITETIWRDYGDETGLVTEVIRRLAEKPAQGGLLVPEKFQTPDLARATHPLWPRLPQPVQVDDGSGDPAGTNLDPNSDGLYPGFVRRWANGGWTSLDACWIRPVDLQGDNEATVAKLRQLDTLIGRLSGVETSESSTRPVYLCREGTGSAGKGAPIGTVWGGVLAPVQNTVDGLYYMDRNGQPDTDWAFMDGVSNVSGSGMAMWDRLGSPEKDTFFVRARASATKADNTAAGRTVAPVTPQVDLVTLSDHFDHTHESLGLCNAQYVLGSGGDPRLCAYPESAGGGTCDAFGTSGVRDILDFTASAPAGVIEHTFTNGQGVADPTVNDIEMTPPNKQWHWFERIAETGAMGQTPFAAMAPQVSQPMVPLPVEPITAGAVYQDDGSP